MWFLDESCELRNTFWFNLNRYEQISDIARFRMGSHRLNVEMGRFNGIPRSKRLCSCCDRSEVEDEMHLLICPKYDHIRNNLDLSFKQLLSLQPQRLESWICICAPIWTLALYMMRLCRPIVSGTNWLLICLRVNIVVMIYCHKHPIIWDLFFLLHQYVLRHVLW
jgi:hypothetical protein